jgi:hypothetical protein
MFGYEQHRLLRKPAVSLSQGHNLNKCKWKYRYHVFSKITKENVMIRFCFLMYETVNLKWCVLTI